MEEASGKPRLTALRMLAARRLTEAQLWAKLERKGFQQDAIRDTIAWCRAEGYVDDRLFARLYVDDNRKTVSNSRLIAEMMRRGIEREAALAAIDAAETTQDDRLHEALKKIARKSEQLSYPLVARKLERLGFPASSIYRALREHAARFGPLAGPSPGETLE